MVVPSSDKFKYYYNFEEGIRRRQKSAALRSAPAEFVTSTPTSQDFPDIFPIKSCHHEEKVPRPNKSHENSSTEPQVGSESTSPKIEPAKKSSGNFSTEAQVGSDLILPKNSGPSTSSPILANANSSRRNKKFRNNSKDASKIGNGSFQRAQSNDMEIAESSESAVILVDEMQHIILNDTLSQQEKSKKRRLESFVENVSNRNKKNKFLENEDESDFELVAEVDEQDLTNYEEANCTFNNSINDPDIIITSDSSKNFIKASTKDISQRDTCKTTQNDSKLQQKADNECSPSLFNEDNIDINDAICTPSERNSRLLGSGSSLQNASKKAAKKRTKNTAENKSSETSNHVDSSNSLERRPIVAKDLLQGIVAYVEVHSGDASLSSGVRKELISLGAEVAQELNSDVTHVVFNQGHPYTLIKARAQGCHLVSVLWIEECKKAGSKVSEKEHPPLNFHYHNQDNTMLKWDRRYGLPRSDSDSSSVDLFSDDENAKVVPEKVKFKDARVVLKNLTSSEILDEKEKLIRNDPNCTTALKKIKKRRLLNFKGHVLDNVAVNVDFDDGAPTQGCPHTFTPEEEKRKKKKKPSSPAPNWHRINSDDEPQLASSQPDTIAVRNANVDLNSRRSSVSFKKSSKSSKSSKSKKKRGKTNPAIRKLVCTFMHRNEVKVVNDAVGKLGGWKVEATVTSETSHVICGQEKRTINLLRGIAYGCWILRLDWVLQSLKAQRWLDEEPFEITGFPAAQQCRVARETLRARPSIFSDVGPIFISKESTPPHSELSELVKLCGGRLVSACRQGQILIGVKDRSRPSLNNSICVNELWVLDSIQNNIAQPLINYRIIK